MVISIGSNVQFNESRLKFEAMILEEVPSQEFYNQSLRVVILGLIRPEAYFPEFPSFIQAMENDIHVTKQMLVAHPSAQSL